MNHLNTSPTLYSQAHILIEIESLVHAVGQPHSAPVFDQLACNVLRYLSVYYPNYDYSEHLQAFWYGCQQAGVQPNTQPSQERLSLLVQAIALQVQTHCFKRRVSDRRYQAKQNCKSIQQYALQLHERYSRLLVLRVDLYYRMECQHLVGIDMAYQHLESMRKAKYGNQLFEHLVGSAWCIEQGETRGYHLHTVYYFKGSEHQNDWYMAQQIGRLWERVTQGLGTYHSCNTSAEKDKYDQLGMLGVGMIHRNDRVACENSINAVGYLADSEKEDQYLRMKPNGKRTFATGQ